MKDISIAISVVVAIVVFLGGYVFHAYHSLPFIDSYLPAQSQSKDEKKTLTKSPIAPQSQPQTKKMGETFMIGDMQYKIDSAENLGNDLGKLSEALNKKASDDFKSPTFSSIETYGFGTTAGNFVGIKFQVANKGLVESPVDIKFAVVDSFNRQYSVDENSLFIQVSGYSGYCKECGNSLKPGFYRKYISIFEITKDSKNLKLAIWDSSNKLLYYIPLSF
jgi:hypothetical protein